MLTLIRKTKDKAKDGSYIYLCKCFCGNNTKVTSSKFNKGRVKSCGCLRGKSGTHHRTKHPLYARYKMMLQRCNNPNNKSYKNYGGRGIKVCRRWSLPMPQGFDNFVNDMGKCPRGYSLERLDNESDYKPSNCIWAGNRSQANNKRSSRFITLSGDTKTIAEWCVHLNCTDYKLLQAIKLFGNDINKISEHTSKLEYINNTSGYRGLRFDPAKDRWIYRKTKNYKTKSKSFITKEEAIKYIEEATNED